ncbi:hypothetical protein O6H91_20G039100 [Diphasiastrum complanatum]|uniref:Uncharacterized protein n=1 Tax=Diphasiastrum complanatum TaxID=34168 RepID=A0ACC2APJ2_DIPCM|nr:hypothetical protein O6H91_20G039100 [Diphasiastrum complanatum]
MTICNSSSIHHPAEKHNWLLKLMYSTIGMAEQEFSSHVILLFLGLIILFCVSVSAEPPGFLSISCESSSNFNDTVTGLPWVTDAPYVQTGSVASLDDEALFPYLRHLRYFPDAPTKHCYVMPVQESTTYLVRTWFRYGNYDGLNKTPTFDLLFNANEWMTNFTPPDEYYYEITIKTQYSSNFSVRVARTSPTDTPLISALELRPLLPSMYSFVKNENFVLGLHQRMDTGSLSVDNLK